MLKADGHFLIFFLLLAVILFLKTGEMGLFVPVKSMMFYSLSLTFEKSPLDDSLICFN